MPLYSTQPALVGLMPGTASTVAVVNPWNQWVAISTATNQTIWTSWVSTATTTTATTTVSALSGLGSGNPYGGLLGGSAPRPLPTAEQVAQLEAQRRASDEARKKRTAAEARARTLMRDTLTAVQREALDLHGWFLVEGGKSGKLYRVYGGRGYAGNIYELDDKQREIARYCVHANDNIPLSDHLLAQALSLRFDEEFIIGKANRTALRVAA